MKYFSEPFRVKYSDSNGKPYTAIGKILIDQKNIPLIVTSDQAIYNNSNYNTKFSQNVLVEYLDNTITSNKMDFDFNNNLITIYENVEYDGIQGKVVADSIKINLITKKVEIYMYNNNNPTYKIYVNNICSIIPRIYVTFFKISTIIFIKFNIIYFKSIDWY